MVRRVDVLTIRPRLLLADGDAQLGPVMARVLEEVYEVTLIADGREALQAALSAPLSAMVVEHRLPGLDGVSLIEELRLCGVNTPALMLAEHASVEDKVRGLDAGASDYLVKPVADEELFARLRAIRRINDDEGQFI